MPYPFAPQPSFDELFLKLRGLGVQVTLYPLRFRDLEGEEYQFAEMVRVLDDGRVLPCMQPIPVSDTHPTWSLIRSVCACLEIDPALFGLDAEGPPP